jgi:hypothetical protein
MDDREARRLAIERREAYYAAATVVFAAWNDWPVHGADVIPKGEMVYSYSVGVPQRQTMADTGIFMAAAVIGDILDGEAGERRDDAEPWQLVEYVAEWEGLFEDLREACPRAADPNDLDDDEWYWACINAVAPGLLTLFQTPRVRHCIDAVASLLIRELSVTGDQVHAIVQAAKS